MTLRLWLVCGALFVIALDRPLATYAQAAQPPKKAPLSAAGVDALLARMTLEEKAGQLAQWPGGEHPTGPTAAAGSENDIRQGHVGSFLGVWGAEATHRLQQIAVDESRLHIPLLFSADVIHGWRTVFPVPLAEAATWDPDLAERCARTAALEATAYGLNWTYAPMVDIGRDARWGRGVEGAGEDPFLGAAFATARVRGFQSNAGAPTSMLATAKHFVAYGAAESGRDYNVADVSERTLREIYLPPFRAALEAGAGSVMISFNELGGVPMHANRTLVHDMLRDQWGFRGVVVSDYVGIRELITQGVSADEVQAGMLALRASIDVDMISGIYLKELPQLVRSRQLPQKLVDDAVRRVLEAKRKLGLFDDPYRFSDARRERTDILTPEARALARQVGQKAIVLLKNQGDVLPLRKDVATLAVIGSLADDARSSLGSWAGIGEPKDTITVLSGLRRAVSSRTKVVYARGASPISTDESGFAEAERTARAADAVVAVVGETEAMSGEAASRTFAGLPGAQQRLLERLATTGKPLIVVLMNGRPLAVSWVADHVPAILETFYLGVETGNAVADVLFGDVNPSGKLPSTFPRTTGQVPLYYNQKNTGRPPSETEKYSSKYLDSASTPLYPFGHGLSYTRFAYDAPVLSSKRIGPNDVLKVSVTVRNEGHRAGEEVVQLYLRDHVASVTRPLLMLRGFQRIALEPGAAKQLSFELDPEDFALLDANFSRVLEPGTFTVSIGGSSQHLQSAQFELTAAARLPGLGSAIPRFMRKATVAGTPR